MTSLDLYRPADPGPRTLSDRPDAGTAGRGIGAALLAMPLALVATILLVTLFGLPLLWSLPVYGGLGAALLLTFALLPAARCPD
ncbi:hypothetical protein ROJ8625_02743 [Roseivivax jejudonensis]|uniref:Uncharacterized protein n=1 Tax=Roseivivax jejudonensis TaxID=1529041 RepID=A0A1X6ZJZ2_9RHOB|nr:hypothetical protein [Roseivivax jejudonensis]SLN53662.1 hypothetical protein ROJ8625_02743 [Roseivivax jejudonensis]